MWGGIDFFVSLETLMTASIPPTFACATSAGSSDAHKLHSDHLSLPGNPTVRHFNFSHERRRTPMFVYPNATLFLQVLCSTGNRVHLMTPWSKDDTTTILKSSEWMGFLKDIRRVAVVPGNSEYSFASLGVAPELYVRTVLVVDDATRWSCGTAPQLMEVRHDRDGIAPQHSMELLYTLSRCLLYSEWLLRYPSSAIASCAALCSTALFSYCRFCLQGDAVDTELMLLLSYHGGRVVATTAEATHVVVLPAPPPDSSLASSSSSASTSASSSSSSSASGSDESTSVVDSSSDGEESSESDGEKSRGSPVMSSHAPPPPPVPAPPAMLASSGKTSTPTALSSQAALLASSKTHRTEEAQAKDNGAFSPSAPLAAVAADMTATSSLSARLQPPVSTAASTLSAATASAATTAVTVTPLWVHRCIRALRILPLDEDGDSGEVDAGLQPQDNEESVSLAAPSAAATAGVEVTEEIRKTKLLLCCLLPPSDARPLLWTTFQSIARQHHYNTTCCFAAASGEGAKSAEAGVLTAASILTVLTDVSLREVVEVRLLPQPSAAAGKGATHPTSNSSAAATSTAARSRGVVVTRATLPTLKLSAAAAELTRLALHRWERRREKEAVFTHLQLVATQFLYAYDVVRRRHAQQTYVEAGTQTSGPMHASIGVMTEFEPGGKGMDLSVEVTAPAAPVTSAPPAEAIDSVDAAEWRHHLKNVEGKLLSRHENASAMHDVLVVKSEDLGGEENMKQERSGDAPTHPSSASSPAQQTSLFLPPPFPPAQSSHSALPPSSLFPLPMEASGSQAFPSPNRPAHNIPLSTSDALFTACFIPVGALRPDEQDDFFVELRSYPIFSSPELGNNVVRLPDGAKCEFATHKAAEDFYRIDYIEFLSRQLPIYPYFEDTADRSDDGASPPAPSPAASAATAVAAPGALPPTLPGQPEMEVALRPTSPASSIAQQAQSLWTQPEASPLQDNARHADKGRATGMTSTGASGGTSAAPSMPSALRYVTDTARPASPLEATWRKEEASRVPPYRATAAAHDKFTTSDGDRRRHRDGAMSRVRRSPEKRRRDEEVSRGDRRAYGGSPRAYVSDERSGSRCGRDADELERYHQHRRHSHRDSEDNDGRRDRNTSGGGGGGGLQRGYDRQDIRSRYSLDKPSNSHRSSRASRRRQSSTDSRDD